MNWPSTRTLACALALLASACGPGALPRFANPPEVDADAGADADVDVDADADASEVRGEDDAGATGAEAAAPSAGQSGRRIT